VCQGSSNTPRDILCSDPTPTLVLYQGVHSVLAVHSRAAQTAQCKSMPCLTRPLVCYKYTSEQIRTHISHSMPRCCHKIEAEFAPSYASVLVAGENLQAAVHALEQQTICPCVTTWCPKCFGVGLLTTDMHHFKCPSAYYAHMLVLHERIMVS
jgi:hypothetical protein